MNSLKLKKWQKISLGLCVAGFACSLLLFVPFVQNLILDFGERLVSRPLTRPVWVERFMDLGVELLKFFVFYLFLLIISIFFLFPNPFINFNTYICEIKESNIDRLLLACVISGTISIVVIIRACYANVWYDEAFTYLFYVLPLSKISSLKSLLKTIVDLYFTSLANNHLLNSMLIAFFTKLSNIYYEEIILRLPTVLFSLLYLYVLGYLFTKKRINLVIYLLLVCNYFFVNFMSYARGYAMSTILVFLGMCMFENWESTNYVKKRYLILSLILFLLSAYANTTAFIPLISYGVVILFRMLQRKELNAFFRHNVFFILIYAIFFLILLKYHFIITGDTKPLYYTKNTSLYFIIYNYMFMIFPQNICGIFSVIFILLLTISLLFILLRLKLKCLELSHSIALLIYLVILTCMDLIFRRGGLVARTLLPGYPLIVIGTYQILKRCVSVGGEFIFKNTPPPQ